VPNSARTRFGVRRNLTGVGPVFPPKPMPMECPYWFLATTPPDLWDRERRPWSYEVDFNPILGGQTLVLPVPIKLAGGFLLTNLAGLVTTDANPPVFFALTPLTNMLIQLTAVKAGYDLFSMPVPLDSVACVLQPNSPGIPVPVYFAAGEVINVTLTSLWQLATATNRIARITLSGLMFL
jgi:hypothetical protein